MIQLHHDSVTGFAGIIFRSVFREVRKLCLLSHFLLLSCHNHEFLVCFPLLCLHLFPGAFLAEAVDVRNYFYFLKDDFCVPKELNYTLGPFIRGKIRRVLI